MRCPYIVLPLIWNVIGFLEIECQPIPEFITTETNVTYHRQDTAILPCSIYNLGTKTVAWRKEPYEFPLTIGSLVYAQNEGMSVEFIERSDEITEWNLIIKNVQLEDAGLYECQISATKIYAKYIYLDVLAIHISGTEFVESDQQIRLVCNVTGSEHPPEEVDWFKDGEKVKSRSNNNLFITKHQSLMDKTLVSEFIINRSKSADAGTYVCRSSNNDVTSMRVHVLTANTNNVKRGDAYIQFGLTGSGSNRPSAAGQVTLRVDTVICAVVFLLLYFPT